MSEKDKKKTAGQIGGETGKKKADPNTVLIPREMVERRKLMATSKLNLPTLTPEQAAELKRFDVMPMTPITQDEERRRQFAGNEKEDAPNTGHKKANDPSRSHRQSNVCAKCGQPLGGQSRVTVTGENYLHLYMEQQRQLKEAQEREREATTRSPEAQERALEQERQLHQTVRARELRDQINYWEQQRGQGQYDEGTINGELTSLEYELGTIPPHLW